MPCYPVIPVKTVIQSLLIHPTLLAYVISSHPIPILRAGLAPYLGVLKGAEPPLYIRRVVGGNR
jgi:hypothetical protein